MTGPGEGSSTASAETGDESGRPPAFGGQRPADSTADSADRDPVGAGEEEAGGDDAFPDPVFEGAGPAPESADRVPGSGGSEAGPEADAVPEPDPLARLTAERDDFRDALVRLQADFENYKKRMMKQQTDHLERAAAALVDKLLPVLDTADLALAHGGGEDVKQLTGALIGVLEREGLERIDPVGDRFDPTLHDAVAHEPGDGGEQEVVEVLRAGYRWKGRVLRAAMVKVRG